MKNRKTWFLLLLLTAGIFALGSCQKGDLTVGENLISNGNMRVVLIDTFTVSTSTVAVLDTFVTSQDSSVFVGSWKDTNTGTQNLIGYATPTYPTHELYNQQQITYDSLVLELPYAYTYGDTNSVFNLNIHSLESPLANKAFYATESAAYNSVPVTKQSFLPRRYTDRVFRQRLPNALGLRLFNGLQNRSISDINSLQDILPGYAFVGTSTSNTILGLNVTRATAGIKVYYHANTLDAKAQSVNIPFWGSHFTQSKTNFAGTPFANLKNPSDVVSSTATGNTAFITTGGSLRTRIEFPYLERIKENNLFMGVNRAELIVEPVRFTIRDNTPPPATLGLYQVNVNNNILAIISPTQGGNTTVSAAYTYVNSDLLQNQYTFNLTGYFDSVLRNQTLNRAILIDVVNSPTALNFSRVALGDQRKQDYRLKLRLYLTPNQ